MRVSVVIPVHNEAGNIAPLLLEVGSALASESLAEIIVVDDASEDATGDEIKALMGVLPMLRYLKLARRVGQSAALRTGILAAACPVVATMDGDGQNDPRDLAVLLRRIGIPGTRHPALVAGIRQTMRATPAKRRASRVANAVRRRVLGDDCRDTGCGLKVFWREAYLRLPFFTSIHRYLPVLFQAYGLRVAYVPVNDRERRHGISKYDNLGRAMIGAADLLGVLWLRRRTVVPVVAEDSLQDQQVAALPGRPARRLEIVR